MNRSTALRLSAVTLPMLAALAIFACSDVTAPSGAAHGPRAALAVNPVFQADGATGIVDFVKVHIVLHRADGTVALDTVVDFPAGASQLSLDLNVVLSAAAPPSGEDFTLNLEMLNAAGVVVFTAGPITVRARQGTPLPPVDVPTTYVGPGANATRVDVAPSSVTLLPLTGTDFTATAFDASNAALPGTPVQWTSLDPSIIAFPSATSGHAVAGGARGTTHVRATLVTGQTADATVVVRPAATAIGPFSGGAQFGTVGTALAQPLVAKVTAGDGLGVGGVTVTFAVVSGGGTVATASAVSDDQGLASTVFTLGGTAGPAVISASAAGLSGSPATFAATGVPGTATQLAFAIQPVNSVESTNIPVTVEARDAFNNVAGSYAGTVTLALDAPPAGVSLQGTLSATAVAGVATFSGVKVVGSATGLHLRATGTSITTTVASNAFSTSAGPANQLVIVTQPTQQKTGKADRIVVQARNASGAVDVSYTGSLLISLQTKPAGATVTVLGSTAFVAGVATFDLSFPVVGTYQLLLTAPALPQVLTDPFQIVSSSPTSLAIVSGNLQTGVSNVALPNDLVVLVTDGAGDPVPGVTVTWSVVSGGGSVAPLVTVTGIDGTTATTWTLGATGAQAAQAVVVGLPAAPFSASLAAAPGQARTWLGINSQLFDDSTNWSPAGVPRGADDVIINAGTPFQVEVTAPESFHSLTVNANAVFNIDPVLVTLSGSMTMGSNAFIGAPFAGIRAGARAGIRAGVRGAPGRSAPGIMASQVVDFGNIAFAGPATSISAGPGSSIDANIYIDEHVSAISDLIIEGSLISEGIAGLFSVGGFHVTVSDVFQTIGGGRLSMQNGAGVLEVFGEVDFEGGSTTGLLTDGQLIAHNNFVQVGLLGTANPGSFLRTPTVKAAGARTAPGGRPRDPRAVAMMARARDAYFARHPGLLPTARDRAVAAHRANRSSVTAFMMPPRLQKPRKAPGAASVTFDPNAYTDSYAPSGGHTTVLLDGNEGEVFFDTPQSHFQNVVFDNGNWFLNNDVAALGDASFAPTAVAELDGTASFIVQGVLTANPATFVDVSQVVLSHNYVGAGFIEPDNLVFATGGTFVLSQQTNPGMLPLGISVQGDASLVPGETLEIQNDFTVQLNGTFDVNGGTLITDSGNFITTDNGRLIMDGANDVLNIADGLDFEGGTSVLSDGNIHIMFGSFFQGDGAADAFAASGSNTVTFGAVDGEIQFLNPGTGAGTSHFANVGFDGTGGADLSMNTPMFVTGVLSAADGIGTVTLTGSGSAVSVQGISIPSAAVANQTIVRFDGVPLVVGLPGGADVVTVMNNTVFNNFDSIPGVAQLTLNRTAGVYNFIGITFGTPCANTFQYIFGHDGGLAPVYTFTSPVLDTSILNGCAGTIGHDGLAQVVIVP